MPIANSPWAGNSGGTQPGGSSDGRHPARSSARSALSAGPCSNSLVPIIGFQLPQRITRCTVPGAPGFTETVSLDAMAPGAAFRSSDPPTHPPDPHHQAPTFRRGCLRGWIPHGDRARILVPGPSHHSSPSPIKPQSAQEAGGPVYLVIRNSGRHHNWSHRPPYSRNSGLPPGWPPRLDPNGADPAAGGAPPGAGPAVG